MKPEDSGQAPTVEDLAKEIDSLRKQNEKLVAENERLRKELEPKLSDSFDRIDVCTVEDENAPSFE